MNKSKEPKKSKSKKKLRPIFLLLLLIPISSFLYFVFFNIVSSNSIERALGIMYENLFEEPKDDLIIQSSDNTVSNIVSENTAYIESPTVEELENISLTPTVTLSPTPKPTTKPVVKTTNIPSFTSTPIPPLQPGQVGPNCPISTQNCVPCVSGESSCRMEAGKTTGFKGWSCQNNNPGNIRPASFKNDMIRNNGGTPPCGERSGYMVFSDYNTGRNGLKAYVKGISRGEHSAYKDTTAGIYCGECNLKFFFGKYAPSGDQNNPTSYANNVANWIGVNADTTTLNWIVANKLDQFVDAIQRQEGWFVY